MAADYRADTEFYTNTNPEWNTQNYFTVLPERKIPNFTSKYFFLHWLALSLSHSSNQKPKFDVKKCPSS